MNRNKRKNLMKIVSLICVTLLLFGIQSCSPEQPESGGQLFNLGTGLESRSISFENPRGQKGQGGQIASKLGAGRKGFPLKFENTLII